MVHSTGAVYQFRAGLTTPQADIPGVSAQEAVQTYIPLNQTQQAEFVHQVVKSGLYTIIGKEIYVKNPDANFPSGVPHFPTVGDVRSIIRELGVSQRVDESQLVEGLAIAEFQDDGLHLMDTNSVPVRNSQKGLVELVQRGLVHGH